MKKLILSISVFFLLGVAQVMATTTYINQNNGKYVVWSGTTVSYYNNLGVLIDQGYSPQDKQWFLDQGYEIGIHDYFETNGVMLAASRFDDVLSYWSWASTPSYAQFGYQNCVWSWAGVGGHIFYNGTGAYFYNASAGQYYQWIPSYLPCDTYVSYIPSVDSHLISGDNWTEGGVPSPPDILSRGTIFYDYGYSGSGGLPGWYIDGISTNYNLTFYTYVDGVLTDSKHFVELSPDYIESYTTGTGYTQIYTSKKPYKIHITYKKDGESEEIPFSDFIFTPQEGINENWITGTGIVETFQSNPRGFELTGLHCNTDCYISAYEGSKGLGDPVYFGSGSDVVYNLRYSGFFMKQQTTIDIIARSPSLGLSEKLITFSLTFDNPATTIADQVSRDCTFSVHCGYVRCSNFYDINDRTLEFNLYAYQDDQLYRLDYTGSTVRTGGTLPLDSNWHYDFPLEGVLSYTYIIEATDDRGWKRGYSVFEYELDNEDCNGAKIWNSSGGLNTGSLDNVEQTIKFLSLWSGIGNNAVVGDDEITYDTSHDTDSKQTLGGKTAASIHILEGDSTIERWALGIKAAAILFLIIMVLIILIPLNNQNK